MHHLYSSTPLALIHAGLWAVTLVLGGCTKPASETCSSGIVCPIESTCAQNGEICIYDDCGDGQVQPGEQCDDGNKTNGDGCSADCLSTERCGDGFVNEAAGEACDDGNTVGNDGCSADCTSAEECGNGVKDPNEICDDGNTEDGDGCRSDCQSNEQCGNGVIDFHLDEKCDPGLTPDECNSDCTSNLTCGNGETDPGEECDDSDNGDNTDDCVTTDTLACRSAYCGDGFLREKPANADDKEECDDAGESTTCNDNCTSATGTFAGSPDGCGDGRINTALNETCDDGFGINGTHGHCNLNCNSDAVCGDGFLTLPEVCDPSDVNSTFTDTLGITVGCLLDCTGYAPHCGDGGLDAALGEECDHGLANSDTAYGGCTTACKRGAYCGDGVKTELEECDRGEDDDGSPIATTLTRNVETPIWIGADVQCSTTCTVGPSCGDGAIQSTEACEVGQSFSVMEPNASRAPIPVDKECSLDCQGYCGNGMENAGEGCDLGPFGYDDMNQEEGNGANVDGNNALASIEEFECRTDCTACGDGNTETLHQEQCDNKLQRKAPSYDGDECNNLCQFNAYCGDADTTNSESCDWGSDGHRDTINGGNVSVTYLSTFNAGDQCNILCKHNPYCGDGTTDFGDEDCDKGPDISDYVAEEYGRAGCNVKCRNNARCGDDNRDTGEACDDGDGGGPNDNKDGYFIGKSCSTSCTVNRYCGDSKIDNVANNAAANYETCDDGQGPNGNTTAIEYNHNETCGPTCVKNAFCGDFTRNGPDEECDVQDERNGSTYQNDGSLVCNSGCTFNPRCGDGARQAASGEQCDGSDDTACADAETCNSSCRCQ